MRKKYGIGEEGMDLPKRVGVSRGEHGWVVLGPNRTHYRGFLTQAEAVTVREEFERRGLIRGRGRKYGADIVGKRSYGRREDAYELLGWPVPVP